MKKEKLWIVTELFYPEETSTSYILTEIANKLAEKYQVNVICGPEIYDVSKKTKGLTHISLSKDVIVKHFSIANLNKNNLFLRFIRLILMSLRLSFSLFYYAKRDEKVLLVTNPPLLLLIVSLFKFLKKYNITILVHDVFPENTIPSHIIRSKNSFIYLILTSLFEKAYSRADCLIVLGRDMKDVLQKKINRFKKKPKIEIIENWADIENIKPLLRILKNGKITFQYAGNLGRVQGLMNLLENIKNTNNDLLNFDLWGTGALQNELQNYIISNDMLNVSIMGAYNRSQQNEIINDCDIAIISLAEGMYGLGVPSKVYNVMAAGKPILFIGDLNSEIGLMVKEHKIGYCFSPLDNNEIIDFFNNLTLNDISLFREKGEIARQLVESNYSEECILNKFQSII